MKEHAHPLYDKTNLRLKNSIQRKAAVIYLFHVMIH